MKRKTIQRYISLLVINVFLVTSSIPISYVNSQELYTLPPPGTMVVLSPNFLPPVVRGITIHPSNPLKFDFIIDHGDKKLPADEVRRESLKQIKYFMAALTISENDLWVNLSPYEKGRIIPKAFGETEMGRDMLTQDYILKQLTASLIYPEDDLGKKFWERIYKKAYELYGTTDIPVNTFNKVWIVPDAATVYEHNNSAFVVESRLKVMLEEDYLAFKESAGSAAITGHQNDYKLSAQTSELVREVLIPEIEREVNEGENFVELRQIYNAMIIAAWYKVSLANGLLGRVYMDQEKIRGVDLDDKQVKLKIYEQYLQAFKEGVYNYIKEEYNPIEQEVVSRTYFSGGFSPRNTAGDLLTESLNVVRQQSNLSLAASGALDDFKDRAMAGKADRITINLAEAVDKERAGSAFSLSSLQELREREGADSMLKQSSRRSFLGLGARMLGLSGAALFCGTGCASQASAQRERVSPPRARTRPLPQTPRQTHRKIYKPSKPMLGVGQNIIEIDDYYYATRYDYELTGQDPDRGVEPGVVMGYTSIQTMDGLYSPADYGGGIQHAQLLADRYPNSTLQIGLYMVDVLDRVIAGEYDHNIEKLAGWLKQVGRPVYLRIGYEFDGPHNRYNPQKYIEAYRYVVDKLTELNVDNVSYVWHSAVVTDEQRQSRPFTDWYPGDEYVDWVGVSIFGLDQILRAQEVFDFARQEGKEIMIAESSPMGLSTTGEKQNWLQQVFQFIEDNNVSILSWINTDWNSLPMFQKEGWGDQQIQSDPAIKEIFINETNEFLQSSPVLFEELESPAANDQAMAAQPVGGIDFDPTLLNLQIKRDGSGVPLAIGEQDLESVSIEGFYPVIVNISPVVDLPFLLGEAGTPESILPAT